MENKKKFDVGKLVGKIMKFAAITYVILNAVKGGLDLINTDNVDIQVKKKEDETETN